MTVAGGSRAGRVSQIPALGSLKLQTVGLGQERWEKLSVPLLLATMCSCYQECLLWSSQGLGGAADGEFSVSVKDSSEMDGHRSHPGFGDCSELFLAGMGL